MIDSGFQLHTDIPTLDGDEIHIWMIEAPTGISTRDLSTFSQANLGRLLARYAGRSVAPTILRGEHGKPYAPDLGGIEFNLSHSGRRALIAVARNQPIGVDIEAQGRPRSIDDIAERFFAPAESKALRAVPDESRDAAFLRLWTGKEAVLKALGEGISFGLDRVEFELDKHGQLGRLCNVACPTATTEGWSWHALQPLDDHHAAVAWHGPPRRLRLMRAP